MPKAVSKAQAGFFGLIAGGKKSSMTPEEAKKRLKGIKMNKLPKKANIAKTLAQGR